MLLFNKQLILTCFLRIRQTVFPCWAFCIWAQKSTDGIFKARKHHVNKMCFVFFSQQAAEEEQAAVPGCVHTTAEQRPTAYIPNDEYSLPLPRPYGALAPFKPSEPGSNMRHFRKPIVKPIEIWKDSIRSRRGHYQWLNLTNQQHLHYTEGMSLSV